MVERNNDRTSRGIGIFQVQLSVHLSCMNIKKKKKFFHVDKLKIAKQKYFSIGWNRISKLFDEIKS